VKKIFKKKKKKKKQQQGDTNSKRCANRNVLDQA